MRPRCRDDCSSSAIFYTRPSPQTSRRSACDLRAWCRGACLPSRFVVIAGNHDRGAVATVAAMSLHVAREQDLLEPPFCFTHDADRLSPSGADAAFTLSGHIHPVARLRGLRKRAPRVPIFWQRPGGLVLPSFGIFTGGYVVTPSGDDQVFAVGPQRVVRFR